MSDYDNWKTDPEYGMSHRDLREAERSPYALTAADIREIVEQSGLSHAEFCLKEAETQLEDEEELEELKEAWAEFERLADEFFNAEGE